MAALSSADSLLVAFLSLIVVAAISSDIGDLRVGTISDLPPWVVIVKICSFPACVGARISPQWILAEASCTTGYSEEHFTISIKLLPDPEDLLVDKVVTHDKYFEDYRYAISALKTKAHFYCEFIKLPNAPPALNSDLNVYGLSGDGFNSTPKAMEVAVGDLLTCNRVPSSEPDKDLQLCVGLKDSRGCPVNPGGLVVKDDVLVAIIHNGAFSGCAPPSWRLYVSVAGLRDWVRTTTTV